MVKVSYRFYIYIVHVHFVVSIMYYCVRRVTSPNSVTEQTGMRSSCSTVDGELSGRH